MPSSPFAVLFYYSSYLICSVLSGRGSALCLCIYRLVISSYLMGQEIDLVPVELYVIILDLSSAEPDPVKEIDRLGCLYLSSIAQESIRAIELIFDDKRLLLADILSKLDSFGVL